MRVLYLTNNAGRASTTVPTQGWFENLIPSGLEPVLASPIVGEFSEWSKQYRVPSYQVELPFPSKIKPWQFFRALWQLRRIVQRHGVELIHCNEQDVYPIGQLLARWRRLPVVVSVHFTMGRPFCEWAFGGRRAPSRMFFISPGNLEACRQGVTGIVPESRWRMLMNGVNVDTFRPDHSRRDAFRRQHALEGCMAIGVACALRERKQLEHLFELGARLADSRVRVVIAGGPVPDERGYAEHVIAQGRNRLGHSLVHLGHLTELRDFYNGLDLYINTSREEACSISVLEAMACGCPVVGYPSKSVDGQILPGGGELVAQDDIDSLVRSVSGWLNDPARLAAGRRGARSRAEAAFDISRLSSQLWKEYTSVLQSVERA